MLGGWGSAWRVSLRARRIGAPSLVIKLVVEGAVVRAGAFRFVTVLVGSLAAALGVLVAPVATAPALAEGAPVTYKDFAYPSAANSSPSQDKPQSKLWHQSGAWWSIMATPSGNGVGIFELMPDHTWRNTGAVVDTRPSSTGDAMWQGGKLYVASRTSGGDLRLTRFTYVSASRTYTKDSGFPVRLAGGGSETITVARDSTGRLWTTWTQASRVYMAYSTTSDATWSAPTLVPVSDVSISSDDISAVITTGSSVAIMWSDQGSSAFRVATHSATAAPTSGWTMRTPLSGTRLADDHVNLKTMAADNGRIHAVVKTSRGDSSSDPSTDPSLVVLSGTVGGSWTVATVTTVADKLTRPQLLLDSTNRYLYVLMSTEGGGKGYYKKAPLSSIGFSSGKGTTFMSATGANINDLSTTKDPVTSTTDIVALGSASNIRTYFHTEMSL